LESTLTNLLCSSGHLLHFFFFPFFHFYLLYLSVIVVSADGCDDGHQISWPACEFVACML